MNIRPEIAHLAVPVDKMQPWPGNPRRGDIEQLAARLTEYGQYQPIIVQASTGYIVVGNNRYQAATDRLGWTEIAAVFLDLDDTTAAKMLAADNRTSDASGYDDQALAAFLSSLPDLEGTGWSFDEFDDLLASIAAEGEAALPGDAAPPWQSGGPLAGPVPPVLPAVPATDARYAETPEEEAERQAKLATQSPRAATGLVEMILVFTEEDRAEVARIVADCRDVLGGEVKASDVVLRALRVLVALFDNRDDPTPLPISALLKHAGL